jgi:hypothetical protein
MGISSPPPLNALAGLAAVLAFTAVVGCLATALTFAGILSLAAVVSGLAAALTLTIVLTFARVFPCIGIDQIVNGSARYTGGARGIGPHSEGTGQKPSNCRSGDDRSRWFHCVIFF